MPKSDICHLMKFPTIDLNRYWYHEHLFLGTDPDYSCVVGSLIETSLTALSEEAADIIFLGIVRK